MIDNAYTGRGNYIVLYPPQHLFHSLLFPIQSPLHPILPEEETIPIIMRDIGKINNTIQETRKIGNKTMYWLVPLLICLVHRIQLML